MQINQELSISSNNLLIRDRVSLKKPIIISHPIDDNHNIFHTNRVKINIQNEQENQHQPIEVEQNADAAESSESIFNKTWKDQIQEWLIYFKERIGDQLLQQLPEEQQKQIQNQQVTNLKIFAWTIIFGSVSYMVTDYKAYLSQQIPLIKFFYIMKWVLVMIVFILLLVSKKIKNQKLLSIIIANLIMIRQYMPIFDLEGNRYNSNNIKVAFIAVQFSLGAMISQTINNSLMDLKYMIPQTFVTLILINYGIIVHFNKNDEPIADLFKQFLFEIISGTFAGIIIFALLNYLLNFFKYEVMITLNQKLMVQEEFKKILQNLDEAVITISSKGINYSNNLGDQILSNIYQQVLNNNEYQQFIKNINLSKKSNIQKDNENLILNKKIFEALNGSENMRNGASIQNNGSQGQNIKKFSINELLKGNQVDKQVFRVVELRRNEGNRDLDEEIENRMIGLENLQEKYVSIKVQTLNTQKGAQNLLQIIDVSAQVMFNKTLGEKKLLALINATVSHEMRNPINSINSQLIHQQLLNTLLEELINDITITCLSDFKIKVKIILEQKIFSISILKSSETILNFLVSDILDFSLLKQGKFRKNFENFNIIDCIQEILNVQKYKTESLKITVEIELINFENNNERQILQDNTNNFFICSDQKRIQQVLLNLVSNAIKFSKKGGKIKIICKYIQNEEDLTYKEDFRDLVENSPNGMIEVIVQDSGVGIKEEDQNKLFRLFGFLDETKELNTGGIGLGLHICKMIVQQFGGDIICKSQFGMGASFIFVIALNNKLDQKKALQRCLNPIQKNYQKIKLSKKKKSKQLNFKQISEENSQHQSQISIINKKQISKQSLIFEEEKVENKIEKQEILNEIKKDKEHIKKKEDQYQTFRQYDVDFYENNHEQIDSISQIQNQNPQCLCMKKQNIIKNKQNSLILEQQVYQFELNQIKEELLELQSSQSESDSIIDQNEQNDYVSQHFKVQTLNEIRPSIIRQNQYNSILIKTQPNFRYNKLSLIDQKMNNNRRIMIVDDEPYNILGLQIIISQSGFEGIEKLIDKANNGQEALDLVKSSYEKKEYSYGLIFMDCSMPVMNGYDASEAIRLFIKQRNYQQPLIVACTGHTEEEYIKKAWLHQIDEVVPKPTNVNIIRTILTEIIRQ